MVGCDQLSLSPNEIAGFFNHQFFWKKLIDVLVFLRGVIHQRKLVPETATFGWVWAGLLSNQIAGFFDQKYHWKEPINIFDFFFMENNHQGS